MVSDNRPNQLLHNDACLEVEVCISTLQGEHGLHEVHFAKADFMGNIKAYLKRMEEHLKENSNEARVPEFKKGATGMVKHIVGNFDKIRIYAGKTFDKTAGLCFVHTVDEEPVPKVMFFNDGCKEQKC